VINKQDDVLVVGKGMQNQFYFITEGLLSSYEFIQSAIDGSVHGPDSAQFTNKSLF
jgi:hypothetical protein